MNRTSPIPASRAADRLITAPACNCDQAKLLTKRLAKLHELADGLERENAELRGRLGVVAENSTASNGRLSVHEGNS